MTAPVIIATENYATQPRWAVLQRQLLAALESAADVYLTPILDKTLASPVHYSTEFFRSFLVTPKHPVR